MNEIAINLPAWSALPLWFQVSLVYCIALATILGTIAVILTGMQKDELKVDFHANLHYPADECPPVINP